MYSGLQHAPPVCILSSLQAKGDSHIWLAPGGGGGGGVCWRHVLPNDNMSSGGRSCLPKPALRKVDMLLCEPRRAMKPGMVPADARGVTATG